MSAKEITFESMADSILEMTEEEILKMCEENGEDPKDISQRVDRVFKKAIEEHEKRRVETAKEVLK